MTQHLQRAIALYEAGRLAEAVAMLDKALATEGASAESWTMRGDALCRLSRWDEAIASYDQALRLKPGWIVAVSNRGIALGALGRRQEALTSFQAALAQTPDNPLHHYNCANALAELKRFAEALILFDQALALRPRYPKGWLGRGVALQKLRRLGDALASYDQALALQPGYAEALYNRGNALLALGRNQEAIDTYDAAIAQRPNYLEARNNRCAALQEMKRFAEAAQGYQAILAIAPDHVYALGGLAHCSRQICDWSNTEDLTARITAHIRQKKSIIPPGTLLAYDSDAALQLECARNYLENEVPVAPAPLWSGTAYGHAKIRIAYLSSDFRLHPMASCISELFERHDRTRFDVSAISLGADDGSAVRARLMRAVDHFVDVRLESDAQIAKRLRDMQADIVIDLNGHSKGARTAILSYRPAPLQVAYMGYPGTMGAGFMDYIIADKIVAPLEQQPFFIEKIVHLPDTYWSHDSRRPVAATPTRAEAGLPERGFVFCCFNNNWKITAPLFDIWMRLLDAVPGSHLWLISDNPEAVASLRREAKARGIDPDRLIFAPRTDPPDHLARQRLADLFLDTLPYNAHSTACDALWLGLPLVTCPGQAFAARVASSLLAAADMPELVTHSLDDYEALARKLAREPKLLSSLRQKLERNRQSCALFDTDRFRRHIETAYTQMWQWAEEGKPPQSFAVM